VISVPVNNNIDKKEIGSRLADIRRHAGLTQEKLAELMGVTPKHIAHCEAGTSTLSINALINFCSITNSSIDYIIYGKNNDEVLDSINPQIVSILRFGNVTQKDLLSRFLDMFCEIQNIK